MGVVDITPTFFTHLSPGHSLVDLTWAGIAEDVCVREIGMKRGCWLVAGRRGVSDKREQRGRMYRGDSGGERKPCLVRRLGSNRGNECGE